MTISRLSAGDGYAYYTSVTVSADHKIGKDHELGDYYLETGTPHGVWMGQCAADLGTEGQVTEAQMKALFGDGLHPDAAEMIPQHMADGMTFHQAQDEVRLGRRYARYESPDNELRAAINTATTAREQELGRELSADERIRVRMQQAGIMFRERHGRVGATHEVAKFLASELSKGQTAVAGYDLTFSAPKSVSAAWAIADDAHAAAFEAAHEAAINTTIEFLEREVIRTRTGAGGIASRTTAGLLATRFRHWESREGDPQLHDHVVIANRLKLTEPDGQVKWLTIDGRLLYAATMNASSVYNKVLADELKQLGFELRERLSASGNHRGMELAMISDELMDRFSNRTVAIEARTQTLVADYVQRHGRQPATKELLALRQQATLQTRTPKSQATTRPQLRQQWRATAGRDLTNLLQRIHTTLTRTPPARTTEAFVDVDDVAGRIIEELSRKQSTWNRNHVETRLNIWSAAQTHAVPAATMQQLLESALTRASFAITPRLPVPEHPELIDANGDLIYQPRSAILYTSHKVLEAEDLLLAAASDVALSAVSEHTFEQALAAHQGPMNQGQVDLAHQVACCENVLTVGIGPAGSGKTTAMQLAAAAVAQSGAALHGITVSAAAAEQLQHATGIESTTIAKWLLEVREQRLTVGAGDVILVDEAGMASSRDLADITQLATQAGAFVRLVGDDRQLQAIGAGGALKMLAAEVGAVRLDEIHRFNDLEEAHASLQLRDHGNTDWYISQGKLSGGTYADVLTRVVEGWAHDEQAGRSSIMMASTNHVVDILNQMAQDHLLETGAVSHQHTLELADGNRAGVGDRVVTRQNNRELVTTTGAGFVKNGDIWTITAVHPDGSLEGVDQFNRSIWLPADYVAASTSLGYATTVHRAQGRTVDTARLVIDDTTSREALYVGLTRGRGQNLAYAVTEGISAPDLMRKAATNITQATTARELIDQAQREVGHPAQLVRILRDMQQRADRHRYNATIRTHHPDLAQQLLGSDKRDRLFTALATAEDAGFTPRRILAATVTNLPDGADPTGLIAWRISKHLTTAQTLQGSMAERPFRGLGDEELAAVLAAVTDAKAASRSDLRAAGRLPGVGDQASRLKDGTAVPAWTERRHGPLGDDELGIHLNHARAAVTNHEWAITEVRTTRRDLVQERRETRPDTLVASGLERRIKLLDERLRRLQAEKIAQLRLSTELRAETRTRVRLQGKSWFIEQLQREAVRDLTPEQARTEVRINQATLDEARLIWQEATELQRGLWVENRLRTFEPDPSINQRPKDAPAWAIPDRGTRDDAMPASWKQPLAEMAETVATAIHDRGAAIALEPAQWSTHYLGPVPDAGTELRERWEQLAGAIETWRGLTDHTDPNTALPAAARCNDASAHAEVELQTLQTAAAELRRDGQGERLAQVRPPREGDQPRQVGATTRALAPVPSAPIADMGQEPMGDARDGQQAERTSHTDIAPIQDILRRAEERQHKADGQEREPRVADGACPETAQPQRPAAASPIAEIMRRAEARSTSTGPAAPDLRQRTRSTRSNGRDAPTER